MGYSLEGIGMAVPTIEHKQISRNIMINFYLRFGFIQAEIVQEAGADTTDPDSLIPDILIYGKGKTKPVIVLEIERTKNLYRTRYKLETYFTEYDIKEVFIYDYERQIWYCYTDKTTFELTAKSEFLKGLDFAKLINLPDTPINFR